MPSPCVSNQHQVRRVPSPSVLIVRQVRCHLLLPPPSGCDPALLCRPCYPSPGLPSPPPVVPQRFFLPHVTASVFQPRHPSPPPACDHPFLHGSHTRFLLSVWLLCSTLFCARTSTPARLCVSLFWFLGARGAILGGRGGGQMVVDKLHGDDADPCCPRWLDPFTCTCMTVCMHACVWVSTARLSL